MDKNIHLLWTGGWDSTFRLVELSFDEVDIYPVYVIDSARKSQTIEQKRMQEIVDILRNKPQTKACIHDIEMIKLEDIPEDPEITEAYRIVHEKTSLGSQHEWLARLGKLKPGLELGAKAGNPQTSHLTHAVHEYGNLIIENGVGFFDPNSSSKEGMLVLGCFRFPLITRTERDMLESIKKWGYEDVMQKIWFCHTPIGEMPCGLCHPCEVKMESNMEFLLTKKAQRRYKIYRFFSRMLGKKSKYRFKKLMMHF